MRCLLLLLLSLSLLAATARCASFSHDDESDSGCTQDEDCTAASWCRGSSVCNVELGLCINAAPRCNSDVAVVEAFSMKTVCLEEYHMCAKTFVCSTDADCSDAVWCNGIERCNTTTGQCSAALHKPECGINRTVGYVLIAVVVCFATIACCIVMVSGRLNRRKARRRKKRSARAKTP